MVETERGGPHPCRAEAGAEQPPNWVQILTQKELLPLHVSIIIFQPIDVADLIPSMKHLLAYGSRTSLLYHLTNRSGVYSSAWRTHQYPLLTGKLDVIQKQHRRPSVVQIVLQVHLKNTRMLSKYLITGITVIWIYYLRCLSPPSDMDRTTLSKPSIGISLTASYGYFNTKSLINLVFLTMRLQNYFASTSRWFIRGCWQS